jgi:predicted Fe-S protein YdhL (DUF1289 family)
MSISPCIKICKLIDGVCIGCNRTIEQITEWENYKDIEKENILVILRGNFKKFSIGVVLLLTNIFKVAFYRLMEIIS